jgi:hypothetical protein
MIDALRQAVERAAQQPEDEQAAIASAIETLLDADTRWTALLHDPRTPAALDALVSEALAEVAAGHAEEITGEGFGSSDTDDTDAS